MDMSEQLEALEYTGETEAEQIDEETEIQDVEDDLDEILGPDAEESDQFHAFDSFVTRNEADYDGYDPVEVEEAMEEEHAARVENSEGYHIEDVHDLEEEVIEMEVEDGDIHAYLVDEGDNEIGFVLIDENGNEQEYYYVDVEGDQDEDDPHTEVVRASDGEEFDLGITREGVAEATADMNAVYREGAEVVAELKEAFSEMNEEMSFLKKR